MKQLTIILFFCFHYGNAQQVKQWEKLYYDGISRLIGFSNVESSITDSDAKYCIDKFSEAIKLNPKYWQAYKARARVRIVQEDFEKAVLDLNQSLKYSDNESIFEIYHLRAYSYYALANYNLALKDYTTIIKLKPKSHEHIYRKALCERKLGMSELACKDYEAALKLHKGFKNLGEFPECD